MSDRKKKAIKDAEQAVTKTLGQIGPSDAVTRLLSRYGKIRTRKCAVTGFEHSMLGSNSLKREDREVQF